MIGRLLRRVAASEAECPGRCRDCVHFDGRPAAIEAAFANLSAMSSGFASVRGQDGLCRAHDIYLSAGSTCRGFTASVG